MTSEPVADGRRDSGPGALVQRIAEALGASARASTVYGDPVERDGVTVIPVAKARWGFGGGGGQREDGGGSGGGGGLVMSPIGYIEVCDGQSRFRPIFSPWSAAPALAAGAVLALLLDRLVRRARS